MPLQRHYGLRWFAKISDTGTTERGQTPQTGCYDIKRK